MAEISSYIHARRIYHLRSMFEAGQMQNRFYEIEKKNVFNTIQWFYGSKVVPLMAF